jgi:hypothetical protein
VNPIKRPASTLQVNDRIYINGEMVFVTSVWQTGGEIGKTTIAYQRNARENAMRYIVDSSTVFEVYS